jgi:hypothetical protein
VTSFALQARLSAGDFTLLHSRWAGFSLVAIILAFVGCDIVSPGNDCSERRPAIVLDVVDSVTNAPGAAGARGEVRLNGGYTAVLIAVSPSVMQLSPELGEPGIHEVTVSKDDYHTWRRSDVRVENGKCGLVTKRLTVRLQRL